MMKNRTGFIRIIEAFTMILLIAGVFLVVVDRESPIDFSKEIHEKEQGILRGIQLNDSLRKDILSFNTLPVEFESFSENLKEEIISETPGFLECKSKICALDDDCLLSDSVAGNVYTQEVIISSTLEKYAPRKLKLFCWGI